MELLRRQRVIGEKMMISNVFLLKGCDVPSHSHENEQTACILSGRIRFGIGEVGSPAWRELTLGPGEVILLPSNVPHSALALEDTQVLDVFSPPSATTGIDRKS
jgi:quercetin dioxygenase-like cupin family protein